MHASAAEILQEITDVTRYTTLTTDHNAIVPTAQATVAELGSRGWRVIEAEQSYVSGNSYKGLHLLVQHTGGQIAELQIQSAQSQAIKDNAHMPYEISRDTSRDLSERLAANRESKQMYDRLPIPQGLNELTDLGDCPVREKRYN